MVWVLVLHQGLSCLHKCGCQGHVLELYVVLLGIKLEDILGVFEPEGTKYSEVIGAPGRCDENFSAGQNLVLHHTSAT